MNLDGLKRPTREKQENTLFEIGNDWEQHWWGMPEYTMGDATPQYRITVNFWSFEDVLEFAKRLNLSVTKRTDSLWFPARPELDKPKEWAYVED